MSRHAIRAVWTIGILLAGSALPAAAAEPAAVHVRGSSTFLHLGQRVAEAYMAERPGAAIVVGGGGTAYGYKSIMNGTADVALASGPMPSDLRHEMERRRIKLISVTTAYHALLPVVHPANPVQSLSPDQLKYIFSGRITDWKEVGGRNGAIKVFIGPPAGGLTEAWKETVMGERHPFTPKGVVLGNADRIKQVAADPLAITFVALDGATPGIKPLKVNGVAATADTVLDGRYLLRTSLTLVTSDKPTEAAREFIRYFMVPHKESQLSGIIHAEPAK